MYNESRACVNFALSTFDFLKSFACTSGGECGTLMNSKHVES